MPPGREPCLFSFESEAGNQSPVVVKIAVDRRNDFWIDVTTKDICGIVDFVIHDALQGDAKRQQRHICLLSDVDFMQLSTADAGA